MKTELRTGRQNNAYWKFQEIIAIEMRSQWITTKQLIEVVDPPPTATILHETIFKPLLSIMYNKESTTKMDRWEMNWVLDVYMQALAEKWIVIHFPSSDRQNLLSNFS